MDHERSRLAELPSELCEMIRIEIEETEDFLSFSLVCKRFRELCIPAIFYSVSFPCSRRGLLGLQSFVKSESCQYTVHLTYWMPLFFKPEVLDFEHFLAVMVTPEIVADIEASDDPPAQDVQSRFKDLHQVYCSHYEDTQEIVHSDMEFTALSASLRGLPHLTDIIFDFWKILHAGWEGLYKWSGLALRRDTFQYHVPVLSRAISHAKTAGRHFESLRLVGFSLPEEDHWADLKETKDTIRQNLKQIFEDIDCIRLSRSSAAIRLCRRYPWNIRSIEILNLDVPRWILRKFLVNNVSLRTIRVYNVRVYVPPESVIMLTPEAFFEMLNEVSSKEPESALWKLRPHDGLVWEVERGLATEIHEIKETLLYATGPDCNGRL
ncbi:hypothetical protein BDV12DRAFT_195602 [Aspergillus spectabilis]